MHTSAVIIIVAAFESVIKILVDIFMCKSYQLLKKWNKLKVEASPIFKEKEEQISA